MHALISASPCPSVSGSLPINLSVSVTFNVSGSPIKPVRPPLGEAHLLHRRTRCLAVVAKRFYLI